MADLVERGSLVFPELPLDFSLNGPCQAAAGAPALACTHAWACLLRPFLMSCPSSAPLGFGPVEQREQLGLGPLHCLRRGKIGLLHRLGLQGLQRHTLFECDQT